MKARAYLIILVPLLSAVTLAIPVRCGEPLARVDVFLHGHLLFVAVAGAVATVVAVVLRGRWKAGFAVLYVGFILFMTLWYRTPRDPHGQFELFWSYRQFFSSASLREEILKNIWLFVPLGAALSERRYGWLCAVGLSVAIEAIQYVTGLGLAEFDDVVSNGLGAAIGFGLGVALMTVVGRRRDKRVVVPKGGRHF